MQSFNSKPRIVCAIPELNFNIGASDFDLTAYLALQGFKLWPGQKWHRQDFTQRDLPVGWRPLLESEIAHPHKDEHWVSGVGPWESKHAIGSYSRGYTKCRSRRPVPLPEGWHAHAGGPCPVSAGTVVEVRHRKKDDGGPRDARIYAGGSANWWRHELSDAWGHDADIIAYRVVRDEFENKAELEMLRQENARLRHKLSDIHAVSKI